MPDDLYKKLTDATEGYVGDVPVIHQAVAVKAAIDALDASFQEDAPGLDGDPRDARREQVLLDLSEQLTQLRGEAVHRQALFLARIAARHHHGGLLEVLGADLHPQRDAAGPAIDLLDHFIGEPRTELAAQCFT